MPYHYDQYGIMQPCAPRTVYVDTRGMLCDYRTGDTLRVATPEEQEASADALADDPSGAFDVFDPALSPVQP